MLKNIFWDIALDTSIKALLNKLTRFTWTNAWEVRTSTTWTVSISSWTITTVTTVTTWNIWYWDMWKSATAILVSQQNFQAWIRKNFTF